AVIWQLTRGPRRGENPAVVAAERSIVTEIGQRDSTRLSDGTRVVLAPQSRLTIASGYGNTHRTVQLDGEAFFDAAHAGTQPFIVRAGAAAVRDIGTAFTVQAPATDSVVVAVTTGSVILRPAAAPVTDTGVVLRAGDKGVLTGGRLLTLRGTVTA